MPASLLGGCKYPARIEAICVHQQPFTKPRFLPITCGPLEVLLQRSNTREKNPDLVLNGSNVLGV